MMDEYRIFSDQWKDHGTWKGKTKAHALCRMHRDAGYDVQYNADRDCYIAPDQETADLMGSPAEWIICRISHSEGSDQ